ncbi:MFS transporter [Mycoplasma enhydrae]|uniref:MFS transporter n=1 Tax=Mycoplasma enhydrae TaxID=2499220 RepID=UPI0021E95348|nr:MFS transporter [Mycoplasma enhydrae]MCV3753410.1 MFS transporter [Mycoplasma enhydrae]
MATYLISGVLYLALKTSKEPTNFQKDENNNKTIVKGTKLKSWIFILSGSLMIGIFLYPRTAGLSHFFSSIKDFEVQTWGFYLSIIFTSFSLLGVILSFLTKNLIKNKGVFLVFIVSAIAIINFGWLIFSNSNSISRFSSYAIVISIQQLLFSLFLPIFYTMSFELFGKSKFHKQNGISLAFRIIISSLLIVLFTLVTNKLSYKYTFIMYAIVILISSAGIVFSVFDWKQIRIRRFYNNKVITKDYIDIANQGLWKSEQAAIDKIIKDDLEFKNILDIGCGTGRTSYVLGHLFPNAQINALDISEKMLSHTKNTSNVTFELANIIEYETSQKYDLIFFSFNGFTNITKKKHILKFFNQIKNLLRGTASRFLFTIHDMLSNDEYKDFWLNKIKIHECDIFSNKKVLTSKQYGIKIKNRFYSHEDMIKIFQDLGFKLNYHFKRNDTLEEAWVTNISKPCVFYDISKIN